MFDKLAIVTLYFCVSNLFCKVSVDKLKILVFNKSSASMEFKLTHLFYVAYTDLFSQPIKTVSYN